MSANVRHSSESVEHFTPPLIVESARELLGGIDLDPASTQLANKRTIKARRIFTKKDNGFIQSWGATSRVFLNCPGGRCDETGRKVEVGGQSSQKAWWFKLAREYVEGRVRSAIFVGFSIELLQMTQVKPPEVRNEGNGENGNWLVQLPLPVDFPLCFPSRRLAYSRLVDGVFVTGKSPPHASVLVYLPPRIVPVRRLPESNPEDVGPHVARFRQLFGPIGAVLYDVRRFNKIPRREE